VLVVIVACIRILSPIAWFYPVWGPCSWHIHTDVLGWIPTALIHLHHFFAGALLIFVLHQRALDGRPALPWLGTASMVILAVLFIAGAKTAEMATPSGCGSRRGSCCLSIWA